MAETKFDKKIKPLFAYVGTFGAIFTAIAYVIIVLIMVLGMTINQGYIQTLVFAVINAVIGLIIMQFLKIQGIDLAKRIEENMRIIEAYNLSRAKEKKLHSLKYFWLTTITKDVLIKAVMLAATTMCVIYVVISASQDYILFLLAVVNLIMFACFGLLSLVKAYDFFNEEYIPFLTEKIHENEEKARIAAEDAITKEQQEREDLIEAEIQKRLDLAKKELLEQTNVSNNCNSGSDLLEPSMDMCPASSDSESMVLDCGNDDNIILVCTSDTSNIVADCVDCIIEENT